MTTGPKMAKNGTGGGSDNGLIVRDAGAASIVHPWGRHPPYIAIARSITKQPWAELGLQGPVSKIVEGDRLASTSAGINEVEAIIDQLVSLVLIRIVALVTSRQQSCVPVSAGADNDGSDGRGHNALGRNRVVKATGLRTKIVFDGACPTTDELPPEITPLVLAQLRSYVTYIAQHYRSVFYHCLEHGYHVTLCANKLLDMMLSCDDSNDMSSRGTCRPFHTAVKKQSYGIRSDPIAQLALIFSALIHDVDHQGITNQQLVTEADELAIMYNDQSVAEQRSISMAFYELMRTVPRQHESDVKNGDEREYVYGALRDVLFGAPDIPVENGNTPGKHPPPKDYVRFRRLVIDLVLSTDIASPERIQVGKSKFKAAFSGHSSTGGAKSSRSRRSSAARIPTPPEEVDAEAEEGSDEVHDPERKKSLRAKFLSNRRSMDGVDMKKAAATASADEKEKEGNGANESSRQHFGDTKNVDAPSSSTDSGSSSDYDDENLNQALAKFGRGTYTVPHSALDENPKLAAVLPSDQRRRSLPRRSSSERSAFGCAGLSSGEDDCLSTTRRFGEGPKSRPHRARRFSAPVIHHPTHEFRLGIRRALNLTGSTVGLFNVGGSHQDEDNELKASVVLELVTKTADVAPIMQGWENYIKWSKKLFFEQRKAYEAGRGLDPASGWFDNQITFFDSYGMPMAKQLLEVEAFGYGGDQFANNILENRGRWLVEGHDRLEEMIQEWEDIKKTKALGTGDE